MNKRLAMLEQMKATGKLDSFAEYALALEYKREGQTDEALATFESLRSRDPDYLAMYLMAGQLLIDLDRPADARPWLEQGLELAQAQGNGKAGGELTAALESIR